MMMLLNLLLVMLSLAAKILGDEHRTAEIMDPISTSKEKELKRKYFQRQSFDSKIDQMFPYPTRNVKLLDGCVDKNQLCRFFKKDCKEKTTMQQSCEKTCGMCKTKGFDTKLDQKPPVPRMFSILGDFYNIDSWDINRIESEMYRYWRRFEENDTMINKETMKKLEKRQNNYINEDMDYETMKKLEKKQNNYINEDMDYVYDEGNPMEEKVATLAGSNLKVLLHNAIPVGGVPILTRKRRESDMYKDRAGRHHAAPTYDEGDPVDEKVATLAGSNLKILLHNAIPVGGVPILTRKRREADMYKDYAGRPHAATTYEEGDPMDENVATLAGSNLKIYLHNAIPLGGIPILTRKRRVANMYKEHTRNPHTASTYEEGDPMDENVATLAGSNLKILLHNAIPIGGVPILTRKRREADMYKDHSGHPYADLNSAAKLLRKRHGDPSRFNGRVVDVVWTPESQNSFNNDGTPLMVQKGKVVTGPHLQYLLDSAIPVDGDAML